MLLLSYHYNIIFISGILAHRPYMQRNIAAHMGIRQRGVIRFSGLNRRITQDLCRAVLKISSCSRATRGLPDRANRISGCGPLARGR